MSPGTRQAIIADIESNQRIEEQQRDRARWRSDLERADAQRARAPRRFGADDDVPESDEDDGGPMEDDVAVDEDDGDVPPVRGGRGGHRGGASHGGRHRRGAAGVVDPYGVADHDGLRHLMELHEQMTRAAAGRGGRGAGAQSGAALAEALDAMHRHHHFHAFHHPHTRGGGGPRGGGPREHTEVLRHAAAQRELLGGADLDNMTYEQILALQERVGFVSKGLDPRKVERVTEPWPSPATMARAPSSPFTVAPVAPAIPSTTATPPKPPPQDGPPRCVICLVDFDIDDVCRRVVSCEHIFHDDCLKRWLEEQHRCPICSNNL